MFYRENLHFGPGGFYFTDKHGRRLEANVARSKILNRVWNWWLDLKLLFVDWTGFCPFWFWRRLVYSLAGVKIGAGSRIHFGARFFEPHGLTIGEDTLVGESVFLDGRDSLAIGDHTDIASQVLIYNSEHDLQSPDLAAIHAPVKIGNYCFIGPRAIILPGVTIGDGSAVAAGAVVTKDVPPAKIVAGIPARVIGERKLKKFNYRLGRARLFQ